MSVISRAMNTNANYLYYYSTSDTSASENIAYMRAFSVSDARWKPVMLHCIVWYPIPRNEGSARNYDSKRNYKNLIR